MRFEISVAKLVGTPGTSGWAQIHDFAPNEPDKLAKRGRLIAVIATKKKEEGISAVSEGRELLTRLHEEYFGKDDGSAFNALTTSVEKIINEFSQTWGEVEIVAASFLGDAVYTAVGGGGKVSILRGGMVANILEGKKNSIISASGYPKEGDVLLLGTESFFETFSPGEIKEGLSGEGPEKAVEYFAPNTHAKEDSGEVGVAIVSFKKEGEIFAKPEEAAAQIMPQKLPSFSSAFLGLSNVFKKIIRVIPERKIYVRASPADEETTTQGKRTTLTIGVILLALLIVSIGFGIKAKVARDQKAKYQSVLVEAEHKVSEAESLFSLNPDRARELLASARDQVDSLIREKIKDPELDALDKKIKEDEGSILGEYREEVETFLDLSLLSSGLRGDALAASSDKVYVLDKTGKKIVSVAFATKRSEVVAGPDQIDNALFLAAYEDRTFILTDSGIFEVGETKRKVIEKDWSGEAWPYAYTGNIYLLDKSSNTIWRYQGSGDSFGAKQKWLGPGVTPSFSNAISWTIDGSVWVLYKDGRIIKFTLGKQDSLTISGVSPDLVSPQAIYSNGDSKYVYVLEKERGRVVVLTKEGDFKAQYLSDKIKNATSLVVSENEKKMVLLEGDKLVSLELKHL